MNESLSRSDQLERRLVAFASSILLFSAKLPKTPEGRHVRNQILRSGTSCAANYGEARGAESRADFIHKLKVVFKELNETTIWLEMVGHTSMLPADITAPLVAENRELCRVIAASIRTAKASLSC